MISNKGYKEMYTTLYVAEGSRVGDPVSITADNTVSSAADGDKFCGILINSRGGYGAVQTDGFCVLKFSGTAPTHGICSVAADGLGGVKVSDGGRSITVLVVDEDAGVIEAIM